MNWNWDEGTEKNTGGVGGRIEENELMFKEGYCGDQWIACWRPCRAHCLGIVQRNSEQSGVDFSNPLFSPFLKSYSHPASTYILSQIKELTPSFVHTTTQLLTCCISTKKTNNNEWICHSLTSHGVICETLYWAPKFSISVSFCSKNVSQFIKKTQHNIGHFPDCWRSRCWRSVRCLRISSCHLKQF